MSGHFFPGSLPYPRGRSTSRGYFSVSPIRTRSPYHQATSRAQALVRATAGGSAGEVSASPASRTRQRRGGVAVVVDEAALDQRAGLALLVAQDGRIEAQLRRQFGRDGQRRGVPVDFRRGAVEGDEAVDFRAGRRDGDPDHRPRSVPAGPPASPRGTARRKTGWRSAPAGGSGGSSGRCPGRLRETGTGRRRRWRNGRSDRARPGRSGGAGRGRMRPRPRSLREEIPPGPDAYPGISAKGAGNKQIARRPGSFRGS